MSEFETTVRYSNGNAIQYKCPTCGSEMQYDGQKHALVCLSCNSVHELEESIRDKDMGEKPYTDPEYENIPAWGEQLVNVRCKSCGGVGKYDVLMLADFCPFCGSGNIMSETEVPDGVIPFNIAEDVAHNNLVAWIKKRKFAPNKLKKQFRMGVMSATFVPFWTFDADVATKYSAHVGKDYTTRDSKGNTSTHTRWWTERGEWSQSFDNLPVYASTRTAEKLAGNVSFDQDALMPFHENLLVGHKAEKPSIGRKRGFELAREKMQQLIVSAIKSFYTGQPGIDHCDSVSTDPIYSNVKYKQLVAPIWMSEFEYHGKRYQALINAQTGAVNGKYPLSWIKIGLLILVVAAIIALIAYLAQ